MIEIYDVDGLFDNVGTFCLRLNVLSIKKISYTDGTFHSDWLS